MSMKTGDNIVILDFGLELERNRQKDRFEIRIADHVAMFGFAAWNPDGDFALGLCV